ncbi:MAG: DUF1501 domain-containing protein [Planctomycetia bacterium]|nr:DUF1501 domain-containing protein [Planctomycetia bacterium]
MNHRLAQLQHATRRHFLQQSIGGVGAMALAALLEQGGNPRMARADQLAPHAAANPQTPRPPHYPARAKHVIYLHMAGSPPQQDLFDYKPKLAELNNKDCPEKYLKGERFAFIKGKPQLLGSPHKFAQHGQSGQWMSSMLPHLSTVADDLCVIRSMHTDQFNHAPGQLLLHTGAAQFGKPSIGSWVTYGLGSENQDLPGFVVLVSGDKTPDAGKSVWGSGYLPSVFQGVQCRTTGDPVLYVTDPPGMDRHVRRQSLDALRDLNEMQLSDFGDPETVTRIAQYELAYRMQVSVPQVMDISKEDARTHAMYGSEPGKTSFANNCLLARRLVEQGVRYVQLFDWGWDVHGESAATDLLHALPNKCKQTDQPITALIKDLKQRGLLEDTLICWSGEFGRTPMNEKRNNSKFLGRDHHPHAFTVWMAGGGVKAGLSYGATDELGYHATEDRMHVHDLQATILHIMGLDPFKFGYAYQGLNQRLIGPTSEPKLHPKMLG